MKPLSSQGQAPAAGARIPQVRREISWRYLTGRGIEVGALHNPLEVPPTAHVIHVDRLSVPALRQHYPELAQHALVNVDVIDDGETLAAISDGTLDFVIANHLIEHLQNPFAGLNNFLRVLKPGGVLFLTIPDKRFTFDVDRPTTTVQHLLRDYDNGPQWSRKAHYEEYVKLADKVEGDTAVQEAATRLLDMGYGIHFHVWASADMLEMILTLKRRVNPCFEIELFVNNQEESIFILRKDGRA